jgi:hypothetical protein
MDDIKIENQRKDKAPSNNHTSSSHIDLKYKTERDYLAKVLKEVKLKFKEFVKQSQAISAESLIKPADTGNSSYTEEVKQLIQVKDDRIS